MKAKKKQRIMRTNFSDNKFLLRARESIRV